MKQTDKYLSIEKKIFNASHVSDVSVGIAILLYTIFIMNLNFYKFYPLFIGVISVILFAQFFCSNITNHFLVRKVSKEVERWESEELTVEERTRLFLDIHKLPAKKQTEALIYFVTCSILLALVYHFVYSINIKLNLVSFLSCLLGSYVASLLAYSNTRNICNDYALKIVDEGIDEKILEKRNYFVISYKKTFIMYCLIPVIWGIFIVLILFNVYYFNNVQSNAGFLAAEAYGYGIRKVQLSRIAVVLAINMGIGFVAIYAFLNNVLKTSAKLESSMLHIVNNDIFTVELVSTDFESEAAYNLYLINKIVLLFRSILNEINEIGTTMAEPIDDLTEIAQSTASTSVEQATGVKEILATMEDTDRQTRTIVDKISDVTAIAEGTEKNVNVGFETLQSNLDKCLKLQKPMLQLLMVSVSLVKKSVVSGKL